MIKKYCTILLLIIVYAKSAFAQEETANSILNNVYLKIQKANDYSASAHIKVDLPFLKMLPINAKVYFKKKDKFKVDSKSIAILPRQNFDQLTKMLADPTTFTAMVQAKDVIQNIPVTIVSIIPLADTSDLILGRLWIDTQNDLVYKAQLTTKTNGTILTEYFYSSQTAYGLPDKIIFTVDIKKFKLPKSVTADINNTKPKEETKEKQGKITVVMSEYVINKGVSDDVFK
ncbi:MAG: hypothetical protein IPI62_04995 [Bacteroidetes bacterium]|nr:hypothetical protein [Bacteroidota bacterium]